MKLSRGQEYRLNLGNYEHVQLSAMVSVDALDLYTEEELATIHPDDVMAAMAEFCEQKIKEQLEPELKEAARISQAEKSILPEPQQETPARRERTKPTRRSNR